MPSRYTADEQKHTGGFGGGGAVLTPVAEAASDPETRAHLSR